MKGKTLNIVVIIIAAATLIFSFWFNFKSEISTINIRIDDVGGRIDSLNTRIDSLNTRIDNVQDNLNDRLEKLLSILASKGFLSAEEYASLKPTVAEGLYE